MLTNLEFCLDVSGSMMAQYGSGTRSDKALEAIVDFTSYRKGDAFGLTAFGTEVLHWVPVTNFTCTTDPMLLTDPATNARPARFYRATTP